MTELNINNLVAPQKKPSMEIGVEENNEKQK